jgi:hypothetical protein
MVSLALVLGGCGSKGENNVSQASQVSPEDTPLAGPEEQQDEAPEDTPPPRSNNIIQYRGPIDGETRRELETFSPFVPVSTLARQSIHLKDSLELVRKKQALTDPEDSIIFAPAEETAYEAILNYKKLMAAGTAFKDNCPGLLELTRMAEAADSSSRFLPPARPSGSLSHGNFFFLGGAPFISKFEPQDNSTFTDPQGEPELRFGTTITENANYLLRSVYQYKNRSIDIQYGPPLRSYEMGPQEVRGIGSLIHRFVQRIPVFFITEAGLVPAHLISVTLKLVPENLGCNSDQPLVEFACSKSIGEAEILAVYIPYGSSTLTSSAISRPSAYAWTADVNADGIADLACVSGTFEGISSDTMAECLWFVNVDGTWKIVDYGSELDCT